MNDYDVLESGSFECVAESGGNPRYLAFISLFNSGLYFEAHEALEPLWLSLRGQPDAPFYKGLIQLAGAFVHLTKGRPLPAVSLFKLSQKNLKAFGPVREELDITATLALISQWLHRLTPSPAHLPSLNALPADLRRLVTKRI